MADRPNAVSADEFADKLAELVALARGEADVLALNQAIARLTPLPAGFAVITASRWFCSACSKWRRVELVRVPGLDHEAVVCTGCRMLLAAFKPPAEESPAQPAETGR